MKHWTTSAFLFIRLDKDHGKSSSLPSLFHSKDLQNLNLPIQKQIENLEENESTDPGSTQPFFYMKTKSTSSNYPLPIFCLSLSFKGEKLSPVCVSMQWPWKSTIFPFLRREGWGIVEWRTRSSPLILPPPDNWHGNSLISVCEKGMKGFSPPIHLTQTYTHIDLMSILSLFCIVTISTYMAHRIFQRWPPNISHLPRLF